jgi:hypothetical protein
MNLRRFIRSNSMGPPPAGAQLHDIKFAAVSQGGPELPGWITAQLLTVDGGRMDYIGHG